MNLDILLSILPGLGLILIMYIYMYKRMKKLISQKEKGHYEPNFLLSLIEIISFLLVYYLAIMIPTKFAIAEPVGILLAVVAFAMSLILYRDKLIKAFGVWSFVLVLAVYGIYLYKIAESVS